MNMDKDNPERFPSRKRLVDSGSVFAVSVFVTIITTVFIWVLGLGTHRTLFVNSILSVSILSAGFLVFIIYGLYQGVKLKDSVGKITDKFRFKGLRDFWKMSARKGSGFDSAAVGCTGEFGEVILWLLVAVVAVLLIWLLGNVLWFLILVFIAMLYWIFFRALRLIFKKSYLCKGNMLRSGLYGLYYTILYNFWIYGIIMAAHYFVK
jgi:hypothetical protein